METLQDPQKVFPSLEIPRVRAKQGVEADGREPDIVAACQSQSSELNRAKSWMSTVDSAQTKSHPCRVPIVRVIEKKKTAPYTKACDMFPDRRGFDVLHCGGVGIEMPDVDV
jgi:hypothetical protein